MDELLEHRLEKLTADIRDLHRVIADINKELKSVERQLASLENKQLMKVDYSGNGALGGRARTIGELGHKTIGAQGYFDQGPTSYPMSNQNKSE